jgi:two-component system cell cycle sensor histidine kinase/response regulator CckA
MRQCAQVAAMKNSARAATKARKRTAQEIAELAAIVESSADAIIGMTLDCTITHWNRGAERMYGYAAEEVIGKNVSVLVPPGQTNLASEILTRIAEEQQAGSYEAVTVTKQGRPLTASFTISSVQNQLGQIVGASAIGRDITSQRQVEQALTRSQEHYRLLFESSPIPMWVLDRRTLAFLELNEAAIQLYGFSREEFLARTILDIQVEKRIPGLLETPPHRADGPQDAQTWRHRKKDGTVIDVEITGHDLNLWGIEAELVVAQDVTTRRKNEIKLVQSEERFSKSFRCCPMPVTISTKAEGRYIDVNDGFVKMLGYESPEVIGRTAHELGIWVEPEQRAVVVEQLTQSGRISGMDCQFRTKSGEIRHTQIFAELITLSDTICILAITIDVTEAKRLQEQYLQAQKMEAVGRLADGVAHDFNNMLGVIIGYCDMSSELLDPESRVLNSIHQVRKAAERAADLTHQLLAFSRREVLHLSVLNMNAVVNNVSKMLLRMVGEDIALKFVPGVQLGAIRADLRQVEQVLMNLAINSRDAMPKGGTILIATSNVDLDETHSLLHPEVPAGSYVMLAVSDTGCGMDARTMDRVFEPFFTTKGPGEGTGLGLSMVHTIVKQSGGHVLVESEPGKGAMFKLYFPRINEPAMSLIPPTPEAVPLGGSETILVVEDDDALRELTVGLLESAGYKVLAAKDGLSATEIAEAYQENVDLVLTDVIMPSMGGGTLVAKLKQSRPGLRETYMTGYAGNVIANYGVLDSSKALLRKPFTKKSLLRHVRDMLDTTGS